MIKGRQDQASDNCGHSSLLTALIPESHSKVQLTFRYWSSGQLWAGVWVQETRQWQVKVRAVMWAVINDAVCSQWWWEKWQWLHQAGAGDEPFCGKTFGWLKMSVAFADFPSVEIYWWRNVLHKILARILKEPFRHHFCCKWFLGGPCQSLHKRIIYSFLFHPSQNHEIQYLNWIYYRLSILILNVQIFLGWG